MQCCSKDKFDRIAMENSAKSGQPELTHVCPSKLSKRELEDVYFALMQSNLDLKRIINSQTEKQKVLTTKLQRLMNTQKVYMGAETKECCSATKALVQQQKNVIQELKRVNENLKEQVKQLNMKLCSTKQFLRNPTVGVVTVQHHAKCYSAKSSPGKKNRSSSPLNTKNQSEIANELKNNLTSVSCQYIDNLLAQSTRTTATSTDLNDFPTKGCDENRCQTLMGELKQEIVVMRETLENDHGKYKKHVTTLKQEVDELKFNNAKINHVKAKQEENLNQTLNENTEVKRKLSEAQSRYDELQALLKIEKSKVAELKTQLKANNMANNTIKNVEARISKDNNKPTIPELLPEKYKFLLDKKETERVQTESIHKSAPTFRNNKNTSPKLPQKIRNTLNTSTPITKEYEFVDYSPTSTKINKAEDSPKFIKTGASASPKLPRKVKAPDDVFKSPENLQNPVDYNNISSPIRTRKTKDALEPTFTKKERMASPKRPLKKQKNAKPSEMWEKRERTASPKQPQKRLEQNKAIWEKNNKKVHSATSPIKTTKTETSVESPSFQKERSPFTTSSWKKQETTKNTAVTDKKTVDSVPLQIPKRETSFSPTFFREVQETSNAPLETKQVVDSSMSPIVVLTPRDSSRPLTNKNITGPYASPDEILETADSITILTKADGVKQTQTSQSIVEETAELPILPQEIQDTVFPYENQKYFGSSLSPTKISLTDGSPAQLTIKETEDLPRLSEDKSVKTSGTQNSVSPTKLSLTDGSPALLTIKETDDVPRFSEDKSVKTSGRQNSADFYLPPIEIINSNENELPSKINDNIDSPTLSIINKTVGNSMPPAEMAKSVNATTSPITNRKSKGSSESLLNVNKTVDSSTSSVKLHQTVDISGPETETQTTDDSSASLKNTDKMEQFFKPLLDVKDTGTSPILTTQSQDNDNKNEGLSTSPTKYKDSFSNLLKTTKEFDPPMSNPKAEIHEENISESKDYNNISPTEFAIPKFNKKESIDTSNKSDQINPKTKVDNDKMIDELKANFESCECCECPPMKILRKSKDKGIDDISKNQDQVQNQDERNKSPGNIQVHVPQKEFVTQYNNDDTTKDSLSKETGKTKKSSPGKGTKGKDITLNKLPKKKSQFRPNNKVFVPQKEFLTQYENQNNDDSKDEDKTLNILPEEKTPALAIDSSDAEKITSPQKLDDSGFADVNNKSVNLNEDEKEVIEANEHLLAKIAYLQAQLESLKQSIPSQHGESSPKPEPSTVPEAQNVANELAPRKSMARMKYTAKRHERDGTNDKRPDEKSQPEDKKQPSSTKSYISNDKVAHGARKTSIANQPHFIPTYQRLSDQDQGLIRQPSGTISPHSVSPAASAADQSKRVPGVDMGSLDNMNKRVSLKLDPVLCENEKPTCSTCDPQIDCTIKCSRSGYDCSEECKANKTNKIKDKELDIENRYQVYGTLPGEFKPAPKFDNNALAMERNFHEAPKNNLHENQNKMFLRDADTGSAKILEEDLVQNAQELEKKTELAQARSNLAIESNSWIEDSLYGAQKVPDSKGGQMLTSDLETNQNTKENPTTPKILAFLKDQYAKEHSVCNLNANECTVAKKYRLVPDDCSCPTDPKTGFCYCVQYMKLNAADASLGVQSPPTSTNQQTATLQGPIPVQRRKVHAPLAVTGYTTPGAHDAPDSAKKNSNVANLINTHKHYDNRPSNLKEPDTKSIISEEARSDDVWSRSKYDDIPFQSSKYGAQPHHLDEAKDESSPKAWTKEKYGETESVLSDKSIPPNYLQLQRPVKHKNQPSSTIKQPDESFGELQICEEYVHICNCPKTARRDVAVFRSCSGTLRFRTMPNAESKFRRCDCQNKNEIATSGKQNDKSAENSSSSAIKSKGTFTIDGPANSKPITENPKGTKSPSPENTDREISTMSDLPSEKTTSSRPRKQNRDQNFRNIDTVASNKLPGTSTGARSATPVSTNTPISTSTATSPSGPTFGATPLSTDTPLSLSEGEVPGIDTQTAYPTPGLSSKPANTQTPSVYGTPDSTPAKVEQALAAISEELARCRGLLQKPSPQKDNEPQLIAEKDNSLKDSRDSSITLHPVTGRPHIGGAKTPRVMFTVHIGTMIFSDVAMINYRDMKLVLTWKFYDQNAAMSHMRPGRVVHFDFSTEYDLKLTEDFLNYMKAEELTIYVCEVNKLDAPIAYCSLPLREALLHTNRRADMSLALMPHISRMQLSASSEHINTLDELGVLDLWCMLRADIHVLPVINQTIAQVHSSRTAIYKNDKYGNLRIKSFSGPIMSQVNEDDQDEVRMSDDLDSLSPVKRLPKRYDPSVKQFDRGKQHQRKTDRMRFSDYQRNHSGAGLSVVDNPYPMYPPVMEQRNPDDKRPSIMTNATIENVSSLRKASGELTSLGMRKSSGLLINEVPPNIRNVSEMKQALEHICAKKRRYTSDRDHVASFIATISVVHRKRFVPETQPRKVSLKHERLQLKRNDNSLDEILKKAFDRRTTPARARKTPESFKHVQMRDDPSDYINQYNNGEMESDQLRDQTIDITILWLALNEECQAMHDPNVQRLYVAYTFLGRGGAELETPMSLPKPKQYQDKCYFNYKKSFHLSDVEFLALGRLALARSNNGTMQNVTEADYVAFTVVSEPVEDPLGLNNCEDIGVAALYFGDLLAYSAGSDTYTDVIPVRALQTSEDIICGVLAVKVDGLVLVRQSAKQQGLTIW